MLLPADTLCGKAVVLGDSRGCRILSTGELGSAVKNEVCRPDPGFGLLRPAVLLAKKRSALGKFRFFPALPKFAAKTHCPEANTDKFPSETALLNAKTAFRRFPRTKPDVPSQGLIILVTLRKNSGSVNPISPI